MKDYKAPVLSNEAESKFETVFAKKSGHRDNGNGKSSNTGNIFGDPNGNNDKSKHSK